MSALERRADRKVECTPLSDSDIASAIAALGSRWSHEGNELVLTLSSKGMLRTGKVAAWAGALADDLEHHPTITVSYPGLRLAINTHDAKAITVLDAIYCARLERWLRSGFDEKTA